MGHLSTARVDWGILSKHQGILKVLQIECHSGWGATVPPILRFIDSLTRWLRLGLRLVWSIWRSLPETQILEMQVDRLYPLDVSKSMTPKKLTISMFWNQKVTWDFDCSFILRHTHTSTWKCRTSFICWKDPTWMLQVMEEWHLIADRLGWQTHRRTASEGRGQNRKKMYSDCWKVRCIQKCADWIVSQWSTLSNCWSTLTCKNTSLKIVCFGISCNYAGYDFDTFLYLGWYGLGYL